LRLFPPAEEIFAVRSVADADFVRRQNRGLVLSTLRRQGPLSRSQLAAATGLSNASLTAIGGELIAQDILVEGAQVSSAGARGRPAIEVTFNRHACCAVILELDVNRIRSSLVNYAGTLVDRTEMPVAPDVFRDVAPSDFLGARIQQIHERNPEEAGSIKSIAISVQGILDREADGLKWSPIAHAASMSIVRPLRSRFGVPVTLQKRGGLLAEGARLLYPHFSDLPLAAIFIGSTVAMGLSIPGRAGDSGATEFGHMNHIPGGALCRCGQRGCIEAYAADYGVLRTAYGVPDQVAPAATVPPAAYQELINLGRSRRNVIHAFNMAGRAIGYGLSRLMTIAAPAHVVITGPGANSFELMRSEIDAALKESLVAKINGAPSITVQHDEREPIFQGLLRGSLDALDQSYAAATPASEARVASLR
jgi:predicted NBD/HSP70 family sugar kinase